MIYLDALVVKVRDGAHVANRAAHLAVGVDMDGIKHVLGVWVQAVKGAKFWAGVCAQLANRGLKDVLIVCCDGLTGFPRNRQPSRALVGFRVTIPAAVTSMYVGFLKADVLKCSILGGQVVAVFVAPSRPCCENDGGRNSVCRSGEAR